MVVSEIKVMMAGLGRAEISARGETGDEDDNKSRGQFPFESCAHCWKAPPMAESAIA